MHVVAAVLAFDEIEFQMRFVDLSNSAPEPRSDGLGMHEGNVSDVQHGLDGPAPMCVPLPYDRVAPPAAFRHRRRQARHGRNVFFGVENAREQPDHAADFPRGQTPSSGLGWPFRTGN